MNELKASRHTGFTLLEMSIVIIIIALITGGIVVGKDLIRAARIQSMMGEYDSYTKAIKEFRDKYQALPGDMATATSMWGTDTTNGCPGTPSSSALPQVATCNGDGGGTIGSSTSAGVLSGQAEWFRAWQHLSDAGMVNGLYSGIAGSGGASEANIGLNVPASKLTGGGWTLFYFLNISSSNYYWPEQYGHILSFGAYVAGTYTGGGIMTAVETQVLDSKLDDGMPGTGTMQVARPGTAGGGVYYCTIDDLSTTTQTTAVYNNGNNANNNVCAPFFILGF